MTPDRCISDMFDQKRPVRSLEFFPPRDDAGVEALRATAVALKRMNPDFVSVTYGAGGTTRERTVQVSAMLKNEFGFTVYPTIAEALCRGHAEQMADILTGRLKVAISRAA